ncbi:MAG: HEAT repeat domain-containing protein [Bryobacterales bacterium]|nr:HEAT repeat domain-containing protein [Bryobacterales bacterium]
MRVVLLALLTVSGGLGATIEDAIVRQAGPAWIGYTVPTIPGDRKHCDVGRVSGPVRLEGPTHVNILFRVVQAAVTKIRVYAVDCELDAGGLPLTMLPNVSPAESVAYLRKLAETHGDPAIHAIAMHAAQEASAALEHFAAATQPTAVRKKALFWLANSRGKLGYALVSRVLREDANDKIREHAIFALTLSHEPQAIADIIRAAKEDKNAHVRGQALFWLAQKAARQAIGPINEALDRDPETEVKKKAVFALTQLPDGGVPNLIQVARTNANSAVRKQALFWLGQSRDPRALRYLEEILARPNLN